MVYAGPSVLLERGHMWNCSDVRYYALPPYNCNVHPGHPTSLPPKDARELCPSKSRDRDDRIEAGVCPS